MRATIAVSDLSDELLRRRLGNRPLAMLVGSGASLWHPTGLPTGQDVAGGVREALFQADDLPRLAPDDLRTVSNLLAAAPFEVLMDRCPEQDKLLRLLSQIYDVAKPNPVHEMIAQLARGGSISSVITTNYDRCLDGDLESTGMSRVVSCRDVTDRAEGIYLKIHGSADAPETMIYSLRLEARLPRWKRECLARLVEDRVVVLVGYSGQDFEVCPELAILSPRAVIWNFHSPPSARRSPGLRHLRSAKVPLLAVVGDMVDFLARLGVPERRAARPPGDWAIGSTLERSFETSQRLRWRVELMNWIGHARLSLESLRVDRFRPPETVADPDLVGRALFHSGRYRASASAYRQAAAEARDPAVRSLLLLEQCDAIRCYGDLRAAERIANRVLQGAWDASDRHRRVAVLAALKKVLILRSRHSAAKKLHLPRLPQRFRNDARALIAKAAPVAGQLGEWDTVQQFKFWADRLDLQTVSLGDLRVLPTRDGYGNLGYRVPLLMEITDRAEADVARITETELEGAYLEAVDLGCYPVAWKLARAAMRLNSASRQRWRRRFVADLRCCEYGLLTRVAYRVFGH
jgi:hypothetical protein